MSVIDEQVFTTYAIRQPASKTPLKLVLSYLILTILLFLLGPLDWPIWDYVPVIAYIFAVLTFLSVGYAIGQNMKLGPGGLPKANLLFYVGSVSAILLLFPSARVYTGRWPWEVFAALADQKDAYASLSAQLEATTGARLPLVLFRAAFAPFMFAVLPLGVIYWRNLTRIQRCLFVATILSSMIFSALRGTTRELADVFIIGGSAFLVYLARIQGGKLRLFTNPGKVVFISALGALVVLALIGRTAARLGANALTICIGEGTVCPAFNSPFYSQLDERLMLGLGTVTGYLSQGYYGLYLALSRPFEWTRGLGHSSFLMSTYVQSTGDMSLYQRSYVFRLGADRWPAEYHWSTLMTWLASDITFGGVLLFILVVGVILARSWSDAVLAQSDRAAIVFCLTMLLLFYLPLNNQLGATADAYSTTIFWVVYWLRGRNRTYSR